MKLRHNVNNPEYMKLFNSITKRERKSRKKEFLKIKYSDVGKLLQLMRSLTDTDAKLLQKKLNNYLQEVTLACVSFIIEEHLRAPEAVVSVIGTNILTSSVIFQDNNSFIARIRQTEGPLEIAACFLDINLLNSINDILKYTYETDFINCIIIPIFHPYSTKKIMFCGLVNVDLKSNCISYFHGLVGECFRYCHVAILKSLRYYQENCYYTKYRTILSLNTRSLELLDNLAELIDSIRNQTCCILAAERCQIYFVEERFLVSYISEFGQGFECSEEFSKSIRIPFGAGIAGTVAETEAIINCVNTEEDPLYKAELGHRHATYTRNLLAFPIRAYRGVTGVVEAHNKQGAIHFDEADKEYAATLGSLFGIQLHICLNKKKLADALTRRAAIDDLFLRDSKDSSEDEAINIIECKDEHEYPEFYSYKFIPANVKVADVICICLRTFEENDLLKSHFINRTDFVGYICILNKILVETYLKKSGVKTILSLLISILRIDGRESKNTVLFKSDRLLIKIRNRHLGFPLYNWQHAFSTLHFLGVINNKEKLIENEIVSGMELLSMFLAALCHGMEKRGSTTPFQPACGTTLGSLYSTPGSLAQVLATSQIVRLMTSSESNIIQSMDIEMYRNFIFTIDRMLSYTDLAHYVTAIEETSVMAEKYDKEDPEHKRLIIPLILNCAELSDYSKPFGYCENFSDLSLKEYLNDELAECEGVINLECFKENQGLMKVELQLHLMKSICEEAFRFLKGVFPLTLECYEAIQENIQNFEEKKETIIEEQMETF